MQACHSLSTSARCPAGLSVRDHLVLGFNMACGRSGSVTGSSQPDSNCRLACTVTYLCLAAVRCAAQQGQDLADGLCAVCRRELCQLLFFWCVELVQQLGHSFVRHCSSLKQHVQHMLHAMEWCMQMLNALCTHMHMAHAVHAVRTSAWAAGHPEGSCFFCIHQQLHVRAPQVMPHSPFWLP